ncbi:hypothetical protein PR048_025981 [Dryococelus australis]|uniref:Uncharacterized protein n=1 Tax=Dryococelus australis TaxID=614101 RepID=A0ABQ9GK30_9NEOP|nr:hypothetical protein PR048_025981 [Dryococelus australis]
MKQRRNERAGGNGRSPRKSADPHAKIRGVTPPRIESGSPRRQTAAYTASAHTSKMAPLTNVIRNTFHPSALGNLPANQQHRQYGTFRRTHRLPPRGEPSSIPGGVAPGFPHVGIMPDDAAGKRIFSGIPRSPRHCIPRRCSVLTSLHPHRLSRPRSLRLCPNSLRESTLSPTLGVTESALLSQLGYESARGKVNDNVHSVLTHTPFGSHVVFNTFASHQGEPGHRIFISESRAGRCRWSAVFSRISRFPRPFIQAPLHTSITLISSQVLAVKSRPNLFTSVHVLEDSLAYAVSLSGNRKVRLQAVYAVSLLASRQGRSGFDSRPGRSGFPHVRIVPADAVGRRIFSGSSRFPRPFIPAPLHNHLDRPHRLRTGLPSVRIGFYVLNTIRRVSATFHGIAFEQKSPPVRSVRSEEKNNAERKYGRAIKERERERETAETKRRDMRRISSSLIIVIIPRLTRLAFPFLPFSCSQLVVTSWKETRPIRAHQPHAHYARLCQSNSKVKRFCRLLTSRSPEPKRVKRGENGAGSEFES